MKPCPSRGVRTRPACRPEIRARAVDDGQLDAGTGANLEPFFDDGGAGAARRIDQLEIGLLDGAHEWSSPVWKEAQTPERA